jgi:pimeloyl-ACP methyl ester carboxylesterase
MSGLPVLRSCHAFSALALWATTGVSAAAQQPNAAANTRMVAVDGRAVRVQVLGLERRKTGSPVVVFEAGATQGLEAWGAIPSQLASIAPVVAYDRAGLGRSAWDSTPPTPQHVTNRLRRLLGIIGAPPPYILVGYSWGGVLMRYFAEYHPGDIAGIVFVDPGPIVTESLAEQLAPFEAIGSGRAGYDAYWAGVGAIFQRSPPAVRAEFDVYRGLMLRDVAQRDLRPLPNVACGDLDRGQIPRPVGVCAGSLRSACAF